MIKAALEALGVAFGEQGVLVLRVGLQPLVREGRDLVGEGLDALAIGDRDIDFALVGKEGIVRVVGGVEQVLVVEFAEDGDH